MSHRGGPAPYPAFDGTQNCAGKPLARYFPPNGIHGEQIRHITRGCDGCPFQQPCLDYALARPDVYGIWGGTTKADRDHIRRRGRRTA